MSRRIYSLSLIIILISTSLSILSSSTSITTNTITSANPKISKLIHGYFNGYELTAWDYYDGLLAFAFDNHVHIVNITTGAFITNLTFQSMVYILKFGELNGIKLFIGYGKSWFIKKFTIDTATHYYKYRPVLDGFDYEKNGFAILDIKSLKLAEYPTGGVPVDFDFYEGKLYIGYLGGKIEVYNASMILEKVMYIPLGGIIYDDPKLVDYKYYWVNLSDGTRLVVAASGVDNIYAYAIWIFLCPPPDVIRTFGVLAFFDGNLTLKNYLYLQAPHMGVVTFHLGFIYDVMFLGEKIYVSSEFDLFEVYYNSSTEKWEYQYYSFQRELDYYLEVGRHYGKSTTFDYDNDNNNEFLFVMSNRISNRSVFVIWDYNNSIVLPEIEYAVLGLEVLQNKTLLMITDGYILLGEINNDSIVITDSVDIPLHDFYYKYFWVMDYTPSISTYDWSSNESLVIIAGTWGIMYGFIELNSSSPLETLGINNVFRCLPYLSYRSRYYLSHITNISGFLAWDFGYYTFVMSDSSTIFENTFNTYIYGDVRYRLVYENETLSIIRLERTEQKVYNLSISLNSSFVELVVVGELDLDGDDITDFVSILDYYDNQNRTYITLVYVNTSRYGVKTKLFSYEALRPDNIEARDVIFDPETNYLRVVGTMGVLDILLVNGTPINANSTSYLSSSGNIFTKVGFYYVILQPGGPNGFNRLILYDSKIGNYSKYINVKDVSIKDGKIALISDNGTFLIDEHKRYNLNTTGIGIGIIGDRVYVLKSDGTVMDNFGVSFALNVSSPENTRIITLNGTITILEPIENKTRLLILDPSENGTLVDTLINNTLLDVYEMENAAILILRGEMVTLKINANPKAETTNTSNTGTTDEQAILSSNAGLVAIAVMILSFIIVVSIAIGRKNKESL